MQDKKRLVGVVVVVILLGLAAVFLVRPLTDRGGAAERREVPPPRAAPGAEVGTPQTEAP